MRSLLAAVLLLPIVAGTCRAAAGAVPFDFLQLDAGARPAALGGAYTALANDADALLYNPGALGMVPRTAATFMQNQYFQGVTQEYVGFASQNGFGFNMNHLDFGSVPRTTYNNPDGTGDGTGLDDWAFSAGYGHRIGDSLSLGAAVKYIRESIDASSARGFAADVGALYQVPFVPRLTLGAAVQNMGPTVTFVTANENLPLNVRLGAGYDFTVLGRENTVSLDVTKARSQNPLLAVGLESRLIDVLPIRLGFNTSNDAGPGITAGFGYVYGRAAFDYAITPFGDLGFSNRISVTLRFGDGKDAAPRKASPLPPVPPAAAAVSAPVPVAAPVVVPAPSAPSAAVPAPAPVPAAASASPAPVAVPVPVAAPAPAPAPAPVPAAVPALSSAPASSPSAAPNKP